MLHTLPPLLEEIESRLIQGEDPMPLLSSIQWANLVGWPQDAEEARKVKRRLGEIHALIHGLQAPLRATLMGLRMEPVYTLKGLRTDMPLSLGSLPEIV